MKTPAPPKSRPGVSLRGQIEPFWAMEVLHAARLREAAGASVIHMEVGQPSAPAPGPALEAVRRALGQGRFSYTEALGRPILRQRIARHYRDAYGVEVSPERVAVTTGSSAGINLAFLAAFDPGERVALASPGYPAYRNMLMALGLEVVTIETDASSRFAITPQMLAYAHKRAPLAGILIASPANPTGTLMSRQALGSLMDEAERLGIRFISDEIYHGLVYEGEAETALCFSNQAIVINSFSKYYCMTGWRIGWMVLPEDLVRPVERLAQNFYISPPDVSQIAALAAFDAIEELEAVKQAYARNRELLLRRLPTIGFDHFPPVDGAFYVYASVGRFAKDSEEFARRMLVEAGVAATPGRDFDRAHGNRFVRFSFAGPSAEMEEAMNRLERWLR